MAENNTCPIWLVRAEIVEYEKDGMIAIHPEGYGTYAYASAVTSEFESMDEELREHFKKFLKRKWDQGEQYPRITQEVFDRECENFRREQKGLGPVPPTIS